MKVKIFKYKNILNFKEYEKTLAKAKLYAIKFGFPTDNTTMVDGYSNYNKIKDNIIIHETLAKRETIPIILVIYDDGNKKIEGDLKILTNLGYSKKISIQLINMIIKDNREMNRLRKEKVEEEEAIKLYNEQSYVTKLIRKYFH